MRVTLFMISLSLITSHLMYSMEQPESSFNKEETENKEIISRSSETEAVRLYEESLARISLLSLVHKYAIYVSKDRFDFDRVSTNTRIFLQALRLKLENIVKSVKSLYKGQVELMDYSRCVTIILNDLRCEKFAAEVFAFVREHDIPILTACVCSLLEQSPAFALFRTSTAVQLVLGNDAKQWGDLLIAYYGQKINQTFIPYNVAVATVNPKAYEQMLNYISHLSFIAKQTKSAPDDKVQAEDVLDLNV